MNMKLWKKYGIRIKMITLHHTYNKVLRYWQRWCRHVLAVKGRSDIAHGYDSSAPLIKLGPGGDYVREYYADDSKTKLVYKQQTGNPQPMPAPVANVCPTKPTRLCDSISGRGGILINSLKNKRMFSTTESDRGGHAMATPPRFLFG